MYGEYGQSFQNVQAFLNVIRYEELWKMFLELRALQERDPIAWPMYAKHEDRELTQEEVWNRAIDEVLLTLDERMSALAERE